MPLPLSTRVWRAHLCPALAMLAWHAHAGVGVRAAAASAAASVPPAAGQAVKGAGAGGWGIALALLAGGLTAWALAALCRLGTGGASAPHEDQYKVSTGASKR